MSTDPAVRSQRREIIILGAAAIGAFVLTEVIVGPVLQISGPWRSPIWFTIGLILMVALVLFFTFLAERFLSPA